MVGANGSFCRWGEIELQKFALRSSFFRIPCAQRSRNMIYIKALAKTRTRKRAGTQRTRIEMAPQIT